MKDSGAKRECSRAWLWWRGVSAKGKTLKQKLEDTEGISVWGNSVPGRESSRAEGKWLRSSLRDRENPDHGEPEGMILYFEFSLQSVLFKPLFIIVSVIRSKYLIRSWNNQLVAKPVTAKASGILHWRAEWEGPHESTTLAEEMGFYCPV